MAPGTSRSSNRADVGSATSLPPVTRVPRMRWGSTTRGSSTQGPMVASGGARWRNSTSRGKRSNRSTSTTPGPTSGRIRLTGSGPSVNEQPAGGLPVRGRPVQHESENRRVGPDRVRHPGTFSPFAPAPLFPGTTNEPIKFDVDPRQRRPLRRHDATRSPLQPRGTQTDPASPNPVRAIGTGKLTRLAAGCHVDQ